ncbi:MAG TPA: glycerophosphoryl diester phosphodiesterase membrane domain-containing protein [Candidatus Dormibacteraeota bacterium]
MSAPVALRLRPLEIGDILDETFRMYRRNFIVLAGLSMIFTIPLAALSGYGYFALFNFFGSQATSTNPGDLTGFYSALVPLAIGTVVNLLVLPFLYGSVSYAACQSAMGRPVTMWTAIRGSFKRYLQIALFYILIGLMIVAFCLFPLWFWILVGWITVLPVMFIENVGLFAAMSRSWRLVQGRWWRTFFILFLMYVLTVVISAALGAFFYLAEALMSVFLSAYLALAIYEGVVVLANALINPIFLIAMVLIYFDLRVRKEGLDLFQLAQQVTSAPPAPA